MSSDGNAANSLVGLIRDLINEELDKRDSTVVCQIASINADGTYNITIPPDDRNIASNIKSISPETLNVGDYAYLLKIQNKLNNSIILSRIGPMTKKA